MARRRGGGEPEAPRDRQLAEEPAFQPELLLAELAAAGVEFVVIGMLAAVYQGAQEYTEDVDVTPARQIENLVRLAAVLRRLDAVVLDSHGNPLPDAPIDDQNLRIKETTHLRTRLGKIDVVINPAAAAGYSDLIRSALKLQLPDGREVPVATLERVIASKRASDRPKDRATIPRLEQLLAEQKERQDG